MSNKATFYTLLALVLLGLGANVSEAQFTAQITGVVTDPSGAVVPGATVTVVNEATGIKWEVTTNQAGIYLVPLLPPGDYRLSVQSQGFRPITRSGIRLEVAQTAKVDFKLEIGTAAQAIDVIETAPLLDTGTNAIGGLVAADKIENLPMKGRNASAFMMLVPGVRITRATISQPVLESHYQFFSVNGSRPNQSQFMLDGGNNTNVAFNGPEYSPQIESVQEFRVQTSNFSAEYANAAGAVINIVTKGGTNEFHGSLFEYLRNDAFAANNFFSNLSGARKPVLRYNQFGGTLGGPVAKNRTFFFGGFEALRMSDPVIRTVSVPTALQRAGDFSQTLASTGRLVVIHDPLTTRRDPNSPARYLRSPFAGNRLPKDRINPVSAALQSYYPQPTSAGDRFTGLNNYFFSGTRTRPINDYSGRVDHQWSQSTLVMARFSKSYTTITEPGTFGESNIASPGYTRTPQNHTSTVLKVTKTFSPSLFGEFLGSWARWWFTRRSLSNGFDPTQLGFPTYLAANSKALGFPSISPGEMAALGGFVNPLDVSDRFELKANLSKVTGRHTYKLGALFNLAKYKANANNNAVGTYSFGKGFTQGPDPLLSSPESGFGYATFLLGTLSGGTHNPTEWHFFLTQTYTGFYFQDEYKATSRLSLNLGIRYDYEAPLTERDNELANFDYTGTVTLPNGVTVRGGLMYPGVAGLPRGFWNRDPNNFAPRVGFAYSLGNATVVRGGYGVFFSNSWGSGRNGNGFPATGFVCSTSVVSSLDGGLTPFALISDPFPKGFCKPTGNTAGLLSNLGQAVDMIDRNQRVPYAQSWNFGIQRRMPGNLVAEIAYSGSRGINLAGTLEYNQLAPQYMQLATQLNNKVPNPFYGVITEGPLSEQTVTLGQSLRPYPQFLGVSSRNATYGASTYHAMFLRVERRFSRGFSLLASYTVSKLIDDVIPSRTGFPGESFASGDLQNYYDRRSERALASWDTPQTLVISSVYELPFGPGKPFLSRAGLRGKLIGGWQVNGIALFQSGPPLQITGGSASGAFAGTQRPNWIRDARLKGDISKRLAAYFDTSAFAVNPPFTFGNAPRLMPNLRGPGAVNFDLAIFKNTRVGEQFRLQFRAEAFNAFNRVQFGNPNTNINSNAFGRISSQQNAPRDIQLALKLLF